ncbi:ABC transporter substrate-binding protein [Corynebacterium riegelii]|uniref:ABC transporter substrate-binding protein n=1 Tax=Corynebacterium riegelii TaxID=156976 RepID=UPI0023EFFD83|nr:ABC transporter substrate-binding protein [Corynebacterium riegelii]
MKLLKVIAAGIAASALALAGCSSGSSESQSPTSADSTAASSETTDVKVGIVQLPIFAPVYVAEAKGYFADEGLNVTLETFKSGSDAIPLASSGQLDAVAAGFSAGLFSAIESGLGVKVVGSMGVSDGSEDSPTDLVVNKALADSGEVTSPKDLAGKDVGVAGGAGGTGAYLTALALESDGASLADVNLVNLGNPDMPAALANGGIDAGLISAPFSHHSISDGNGVSLWVPPKGVSGTGLIYGEQFLETETAQKFFNALVRASADLQGEDRYSDENIKIIADATDQTPEQVRAVPLYTWEPDLAPKLDQLADMERVWMSSGAISYSTPLDSADYVETKFAANAG